MVPPPDWLGDDHDMWRRRAARDPEQAGLFAAETTMPFVSYLNHVFSHGGFPGETLPDNHWQRKQALAKDLLPL
jgi:hypothetical protein